MFNKDLNDLRRRLTVTNILLQKDIDNLDRAILEIPQHDYYTGVLRGEMESLKFTSNRYALRLEELEDLIERQPINRIRKFIKTKLMFN